MATNAEAVGRLLANSALMQGERELMRKPSDHAATAARRPAATPVAEPIVNNSKSVEAVLLALLDEQLHATEATPDAQPKAVADGEAAASKRLAARYAADGLMQGNESASPDIPLAHDALRLRDVPTTISADLQSFVQRSAAMAASQPVDAVRKDANGAPRRRGISLSAIVNGAAALRMIGIGAGLIWLVALALHWGAP